MGTTSLRAARGRFQTSTRSATRGPWAAAGSVALGVIYRFLPDRWLAELAVLVLAVLLIGASALYGLAVVSATAVAPGVSDELLCCRERR